MFLAVDIGNTCITFGVYDGGLLKTTRIKSDSSLNTADYKKIIKNELQNFDIKNCMVASVVKELTQTVKQAVDDIYKIQSKVYSANLNLNIKIMAENPSEAGADRVANAVRAFDLYKSPVIVVDMGTATTFDIVDGDGNFIGGLIMPGLKMQVQALSQNTSLLPEIELKKVEKIISNDTVNSILSGVVAGHAKAVEGLIEECIKELKNPSVKLIGTGGNIGLVSECMNREFNTVVPSLTLDGIKLIYDMNY